MSQDSTKDDLNSSAPVELPQKSESKVIEIEASGATLEIGQTKESATLFAETQTAPAGEPDPNTLPGFDVREISIEPEMSGVDPDPTGQGPISVIEETQGGLWLKDAPLNEVFQYLAHTGGLQFFHNTNLSGPQYMVTGQLVDNDDPVAQMEELGLMYQVTIHQKVTRSMR